MPPTRLITAAVLHQPGQPLCIERLNMESPREDEVLVRLVASGICRTDIDFWESGAGGPVVLGHEGAGIVEQVGDAVQGISLGDHVVLSYQSCGHCPACQDGRPAHCRHFWEANFGFSRLDGSNALASSGVRGHFFGQSSFATHALATARNLVKVDAELPLALLAPLGCGLQTGAGTIFNSLAVQARASVVVFGTGSVGLAAVMAARIVGADPIIAVDIVPERLELALELGATHAIENQGNNLVQQIRAMAGGGVDHVLEITGDPGLYRLAIELLKPGGSVALLTDAEIPERLPQGRTALSVIQGDAVPQLFISKLIDFYRKGLFPFERLVTFYPFAEINQAMADSMNGITIKPVLRISKT